jgi:carboxyl-terminal processing protease
LSAAAVGIEDIPLTKQGGAVEANIVNPERTELSEEEIVEAACALIEQGKFDAAGQLIEASGSVRQDWKLVSRLKEIVGQWQQLQKSRQSQREAAYKEQLAELERIKAIRPPVPLRWGVLEDMRTFARQWLSDLGSTPRRDGEEVGPDAGNDANEQGEQNSGPTAILAAVIRTSEFADEKQKKELLSDPCVLEAIDRAKSEAAALEYKGKWFDAYVMYYSWLAAMEPNNKGYADYAERLIEKAEIVGAFQDSPCETGKQRFEGVKRRILERAVDALNFNYVNKIDYREMAAKGIRRCRSLAEVVGVLTKTEDPASHRFAEASRRPGFAQGATPGKQKTEDGTENGGQEPNTSALGESFKDFRPDANATAELSSRLAALEQETAEWSEGAAKDRFLAAFEKVLELNLTSARLPEEVVIAEFAEAAFGTLDPYTVLVWPTQVPDFEKVMMNEFSGIGIEIARQKGQLTVASLLPDTPAYNSGLDAGDVIDSVDGVATKDMPLPCAVKRITGPSGTSVKLGIRREGEQQVREITITRAKIIVPTIRGRQRTEEGKWQNMVDEQERIGYVRLTNFAEKTASELEESLNSLEAAGMRGLILDLRFNSGGFFESAVEVSDEFLDEGLIVITRPRFGIPAYAAARSKGTHPNYPMVVLINAGSASASEIVAGALADASHKRATLVGERTHGKGVVQGITHYPGEGAQLKYTMAYYHLPSGQRVKSKEEAEKEHSEDWGIGPDVTVELRSDELRKMFDVQRDNDVLVKAGHDNAASPLKKHTLEQTVEVDPQLATAILVVKSKLIREQARTAAKKAA